MRLKVTINLQMSYSDEYMKEHECNQQVVTWVKNHLESLTEYFARYFPKNENPRQGNI